MKLARPLWLTAGISAFAVGTIGILLPLLPTVPFYLLAAFCFARSNPKWEQWLLDHQVWGPPIRRWRERGAISRKAKISAVTAMSIGGVVTWFTLGWPWAGVSLAVLVIAGSWIWTRPD
ncbi:MAG: YbaN family protein [Novosphingobium sp.]